MRPGAARRPLLLLAAVAALVVSSVSPAAAAPPEQVHGQHGHYLIDDNSTTPLVNCRYTGTNPIRIDKWVAKPPKVWWSDTVSGNTNQHGTVGWQIKIQGNDNAAVGPWTTVYTSSIVKKTAYEDQLAPYDGARAAPFTTRGIPWSMGGNGTYRVVYKLIWYWPDGSKGKVTHWVASYKETGVANGISSEWCYNRIGV